MVTYERPTQDQDSQNDRKNEGGWVGKEAPTLAEMLEVCTTKMIFEWTKNCIGDVAIDDI